MRLIRRLRPFFSCFGVSLVVASISLSPLPAFAQGDPFRVPCGGWGVDVAKENVRANNDLLGRGKVLQMFRPREYPTGRYQVWKEECSRMDLDRDMHAFWRIVVVMTTGLFMIALTYGAILYMFESFGRGPSNQARNLVLNSVAALLIVGFGMAIWRGFLSDVLGATSFEFGYFNPFGMSGR